MKLLKDRRGEVSIHLALIMLTGLLLLAAALEVLHVYFVCNAVLEKTNEAVLAAAASNVADFYVGARESDGNARQYVNDYWASAVSVEEVEAALQGALGAERTEDGTLVREGGLPDHRAANRVSERPGDQPEFHHHPDGGGAADAGREGAPAGGKGAGGAYDL